MTTFEMILIWVSAFTYLGAGIIYAYRYIFLKDRFQALEGVFVYTGVTCNVAAVVIRSVITGYLPVQINYESNLFIAALVGLLFLVFRKKMPIADPLGMVCLPGTVLLLLGGYAAPSEVKPLTPVLFSRWMLLHVIFNMLAVVCLVFATGAAVVYLLKSKRIERATAVESNKFYLDQLSKFNFRLVLYGFIGWTIMIFTGMLWAKDLWGVYWNWDPIETWSLISWLAWGIYIHIAFTYGWQGKKLAWLCIFCFITSVISIWGVHLVIPETYHDLRQF